MKRFLPGFFLCVLIFGGFFCVSVYRWFHERHIHLGGNNISLSVRESDEKYQIYASYNAEKTYAVQSYLDETLRANHTFRNARINGRITLDDRTSFFIRAVPGKLLIKFDRDENSETAYLRMKEFAEGLKTRIAAF